MHLEDIPDEEEEEECGFDEIRCPSCRKIITVDDIKESLTDDGWPSDNEGTESYYCPGCDAELVVPYSIVTEIEVEMDDIKLPQSNVCKCCHYRPVTYEGSQRCTLATARFSARLRELEKERGIDIMSGDPWYVLYKEVEKEEATWGPCKEEKEKENAEAKTDDAGAESPRNL